MEIEKIKKVYENLFKDKKIKHIYDRVEQKINYVIAHGEKHINNVLGYINHICKELQLNDRIKYLSLIAGALHDVGRLDSDKNHTDSGAGFARAYLLGKLDDDECDLVCDAIIKHEYETFDFNNRNDVAWVVLLADKMDYTRDRFLPDLMKESLKNKLTYNIKSISLKVEKTKAEITILMFEKLVDVDDNFSRVGNVYEKVLNHFGFNKVKVIKVFEK